VTTSVTTRLLRSTAALPLLLAAATPVAVHADDTKGKSESKLTIDASARARIEVIDGQFRPATSPDDVFVSFRTTVAAHLDLGDFTLGGEVVDARGYGESDKSSVKTTEVDALEPVQAYAAYRFHNVAQKGDTLTATAGRFSLDIGSSRLVGRTDFPNTVLSYLGAMGEWKTKHKDRLVVFWSEPFTALPDESAAIHHNGFKFDRAAGNMTFFGASGTAAEAFKNVSVELYGYRLVEEDRPGRLTRDRRLSTFGTRIRRAPAKGKFDFEAEGAYQTGTARATTAANDRKDLDVRAGFGHAEAGWTATGGWTPRVSVMFDYASADGAKSSYGRFDTLFGARRADFGPVALYGPIGRANLVSPGARIEAKPSKRFDLMAAVRDLWLADATDTFASTGVRDKTGASGRHAGVQVEARARRWLIPDRLRLEAGAAYLAKGRFLTDAPNAPKTGDTRYGYMDLAVSF
jgi:hypothetical protein